MLTDQIADMFTRIRNAYRTQKKTVSIPASNMRKEITRILHEQHFISKYAFVADNKQGIIKILLKYDDSMRSAIEGIERISKPGRRRYTKAGSMPRVLSGMGIAILSTSKGMMTDRECRASNVGGEIVGHVW